MLGLLLRSGSLCLNRRRPDAIEQLRFYLSGQETRHFLAGNLIAVPNDLVEVRILSGCSWPRTAPSLGLDGFLRLPDLLAQIEHLLATVVSIGEERTLTDCGNPILIP